MKRMIFAAVAAILLAMSSIAIAQVIAISATGKTLSASVGSQAGRSPFFLLVDRQGNLVQALDNPYKDAGNAGIAVLDFLAGKQVNVLVAEGFGPRIVEVMKGKGIRPVEFKGSAKDAVQKALESK